MAVSISGPRKLEYPSILVVDEQFEVDDGLFDSRSLIGGLKKRAVPQRESLPNSIRVVFGTNRRACARLILLKRQKQRTVTL